MPDKSRTLQVLIVKDDDATRREMFEFFRQQPGYSPIGARTVEAAMEALGCYPFDVVITGENFSDGDGAAVYKGVRGHVNSAVRLAPVIFYTGYPWYKGEIKAYRDAGDLAVKHVRPMEGLRSLLAVVAELTGVAA